ncbi:hypothetical protein PIN31115_03858 [Pandoraea iniqua]|uniref:Lipoprotein n=1 Tax=Pandoraea iniqua TaxID=2508288 RepID=A0A5E4XGW2_9BURK|nr:hypothetical protein [Pandoraea iniqua]VVE35462.1 hypothetical protein PIN31115_03858 [Pandoraea iniqua]
MTPVWQNARESGAAPLSAGCHRLTSRLLAAITLWSVCAGAFAWTAGGTGATVVAPTPAVSADGTELPVSERHGWYRGIVGPTVVPASPSSPSVDLSVPDATVEPKPARQWDRALPFFAQRVIDRGYDLPNPYDVGYSYFNGTQRYQLSNLMVGANGNGLRSADFVQFDQSRIRSQSNQFQFGAWLFPFMNVYGIFGNVRGHGDIGISFSSLTALEQFFGINVGCGGRRPGPECSKSIKLPTQQANYSGTTYGAGFTLVGTYGNLFFSLPVTYTVSNISMSDSSIQSWNISPRIGWNVHLGGYGILTPYVGATWFRTRATITGHFDIPIDAAGGQTQRLDYQIDESVVGAWSGVVGVSWAASKRFGLLAEIGYGYNRSDVILTAFLRF